MDTIVDMCRRSLCRAAYCNLSKNEWWSEGLQKAGAHDTSMSQPRV